MSKEMSLSIPKKKWSKNPLAAEESLFMSELWNECLGIHELDDSIAKVISKHQKLEWLPKQLWNVKADESEDLNGKSLKSAQMLENILRQQFKKSRDEEINRIIQACADREPDLGPPLWIPLQLNPVSKTPLLPDFPAYSDFLMIHNTPIISNPLRRLDN